MQLIFNTNGNTGYKGKGNYMTIRLEMVLHLKLKTLLASMSILLSYYDISFEKISNMLTSNTKDTWQYLLAKTWFFFNLIKLVLNILYFARRYLIQQNPLSGWDSSKHKLISLKDSKLTTWVKLMNMETYLLNELRLHHYKNHYTCYIVTITMMPNPLLELLCPKIRSWQFLVASRHYNV